MLKILCNALLILLLAVPVYADMNGYVAGGSAAAAGCTASTPGNDNSEIGYITVGSSSAATLIDRMYCYLYPADCSGSLGTGYVYGSHATAGYGKISAFSTTDTVDTDPPTNGTLIGGTAELSFDSTPAYKSGALSGGTVIATTNYWMCFQTKNGSAPTLVYDAGKTRHSLNVTGQYTTLPTSLPVVADCVGSGDPYSCCTGAGTGCTWTSTADRKNSVFIGIQ